MNSALSVACTSVCVTVLLSHREVVLDFVWPVVWIAFSVLIVGCAFVSSTQKQNGNEYKNDLIEFLLLLLYTHISFLLMLNSLPIAALLTASMSLFVHMFCSERNRLAHNSAFRDWRNIEGMLHILHASYPFISFCFLHCTSCIFYHWALIIFLLC